MLMFLEKILTLRAVLMALLRLSIKTTATLKQVGVAGLIPQPIYYLANIVNTLKLYYCNQKECCRKNEF